MQTSLPAHTRLPINRCNLPAVILGSLTYQMNPVPLFLDGVQELHIKLFLDLEKTRSAEQRSVNFMDYMRSSFLLDHPEEAGFQSLETNYLRDKADYLRLLRGWLFSPDGQEAAVLKSWVESRFGLLVRNHHGPLGDFTEDNYQRFLNDRRHGLYNSNALESQLDLLYTYCQYELSRRYADDSHLSLFRGTNHIDEYEVLATDDDNRVTLILNNLSSFTSSRERADEFGDVILRADVPLTKLFYFPGLLGNILKSEQEFLVIGGVYQVRMYRY